MATKLYLHDLANSGSGTYPTGEQDGQTAEWNVTGFATLRSMNTTIGTSQTSRTGTSLAQTANQQGFMGFWCTLPLDVNQTIGNVSETLTLNIAGAESNLNMNLTDLRCFVYVWRPSTGAIVGTVQANNALAGDAEPGAAASERVNQGTSTAVQAIAALAGDVVIVEVWNFHSQGAATAYDGTIYYDGTTENATVNAVVTNHASYLNFSLTTMTFATPCFDIEPVATVTWGGASRRSAAASVTAVATASWNGAARAASAFTQTAIASVTWTGQGFILAAGAANIAAVSSVTWNGAILSAGAFSAVETASLTWNGRSFASANFNAPAAASLTWNGTSIGASALSVTAAASLTWNSSSFASAAFSDVPLAVLTWNGAEVVNAVTSAPFVISATATASWNGASSATADLTSTAVSSITWNGTGIFAAAWSATATAAQTWNATAITSADWSAVSASSQLWNGASIASNTWSGAATAALTWNGVGIASGAWLATPAAFLVWEGEGQGGPTVRAGAWSAIVSATVEFASATIAAAGFDCRAVSRLGFKGASPGAKRSAFLDGPRKRFRTNQDDKDFVLFAAAIAKLELDHDYY